MKNLERRVGEAVGFFWKTRHNQLLQQGAKTGKKDYGSRSAVTGGAQLDGFINLIRNLLIENGISDVYINIKKQNTALPGYFRSSKEWDLLVVAERRLIAIIEFKSQVGPSFGNNFNNRVEEALGNASDLWTAYREGAFKPSMRPWLGYLMLLEEHRKSTSPVRVNEPHFKVFKEFRNSSYKNRYELFCERLVRERLYDAACFITSTKEGGLRGEYIEPSVELNFRNFAISLISKATLVVKNLKNQKGQKALDF